MLDFIRRSTRSGFGRIFLMAAMGLLILSFAVWGINDVFRGGTDSSVARVGGEKVSAYEVQQAFRRELDGLRRQGLEFDAEQARAIGFDRRVLAELVNAKLFELAADDIGIAIPDALLAQEVQAIPAFKNDTGRFDKAHFDRALQSLGYTEQTFLAAFRNDLLRKHIIESLLGGIPVPDAIATPLYAFQAERRIVRYLVVPPEMAGALVPVAEEEIRKHYEANKSAHMSPEYRRFTVVDIDPAEIAKTIEVSEADLRARFEEKKDLYSAPEKRGLRQLVFQKEAEARAAAEALKSGKSFLDLAKEQGKTAEDVTLGEKAKSEVPPKVGDAAFAAQADGIAGPVEGPFGWVLLQVTKIVPAEQQSFDSVRAEIAADISQERAKDQVHAIATRFEDARASGATIEEAAKAQGLGLVAVTASDALGKDRNGTPVAALKDEPEILAEAFRSSPEADPDLISTPEGGYFVVRVDSTTPPAERPLEAVKDEVRESLRAEKRAAALKATAEELATKARAGTSLVDIAKEIGATAKSETFTRATDTDIFSPDAVRAVYEASERSILHRPVKSGEGMVLMQLEAVDQPGAAETAEAAGKIKPQLGQMLGNELIAVYADELQTRYEVSVSETALKSAVGGS